MAFNRAYIRKQAGLVIDPNDPTLVFGSNMDPPINGILQDISGEGNHGVLSGNNIVYENTIFNQTLTFNVGLSKIIVPDPNSSSPIFTIHGWFLPYSAGGSNNGRLYEKNANNLSVYMAGTSLVFRYNGGLNEVIPNFFVFGLWHHVVIVSTGSEVLFYRNSQLINTLVASVSLTASDLYLGNTTSAIDRHYDGHMASFGLWIEDKDVTWVANEYEKGREALFRSDWGATVSASPSSACLENTPCRVLSGSHKISSDTIGSTSIKALECVTAGQILIPSGFFTTNNTQNAYGDFDWWMRKGGDGNTSTLKFISNSAGTAGYSLSFNANESVSLNEIGVGTLFSTPASYISNGQWYNPRVQRRYAGQFTGYLNSVLIDPTGGSGTNPVTDTTTTTSAAVIADLDAGDKISWSDQNGDHSLIKRILP